MCRGELGLEPERFAIVRDGPLPVSTPAFDKAAIGQCRCQHARFAAAVDHLGKELDGFVILFGAHGGQCLIQQR